MPAPKIETRLAADLKPSPTNARTHSDEQVAQIAASLIEFGFASPILADADGIVAGHGRTMAALLVYGRGETLKFPDGTPLKPGTVPVMDVSGWSPEQRRAYMLADNKLALLAGWDETILADELAALTALDFNMDLIGFDEAELHRLLDSGAGAGDPEVIPPEPENPVSILGDIWIMGDHRIICGSSTDPEAVTALLAGAKPHLMVTDPPYGVKYDPDWRNEASRSGSMVHTIGATATGEVLNDDRADWTEAWALFPGDVCYVWHGGVAAPIVANSLEACQFQIRSQIIWNKDRLIIGRGNFHWKHEPCWYAVRKGRTAHWQGDRKQSTIWDIAHRSSDTGHGTQKPIDCMKRPIENNSKVGDAVYEPFSGSGTTIIAGQMTGRKVYAVELNPPYVDIAVSRWEAYAEAEAVLEATGQTFAEVRAERLGVPVDPA